MFQLNLKPKQAVPAKVTEPVCICRASLTKDAKAGPNYIQMINLKTNKRTTIARLDTSKDFSSNLDMVINPDEVAFEVTGTSNVDIVGYNYHSSEATEERAQKKRKIEDVASPETEALSDLEEESMSEDEDVPMKDVAARIQQEAMFGESSEEEEEEDENGPVIEEVPADSKVGVVKAEEPKKKVEEKKVETKKVEEKKVDEMSEEEEEMETAVSDDDEDAPMEVPTKKTAPAIEALNKAPVIEESEEEEMEEEDASEEEKLDVAMKSAVVKKPSTVVEEEEGSDEEEEGSEEEEEGESDEEGFEAAGGEESDEESEMKKGKKGGKKAGKKGDGKKGKGKKGDGKGKGKKGDGKGKDGKGKGKDGKGKGKGKDGKGKGKGKKGKGKGKK